MPKKPEEDDDDVSSIDVDEEENEVEDDEAANDLANSDVVTKYQTAGKIANECLAKVMAACTPGIKAVALCQLGDESIEEATGKIYNGKGKDGKKIDKGIAFPTCISPNHCVGHYSPLVSEDTVEIKEGDVVKIDMGVHVDGYIAVVAHTVVCGGGDVPCTGRKADVQQAAWQAAECAVRMFKAGAKNHEITEMIAKVAEAYKCSPVEGVLSHQMKKHVIDANKVVINKATTEQQVKEATFEVNDVFAVDIVMSSGEGKPKQLENRTTVFKRDLEQKYSLKMKTSRAFFSEVNSRFPTLPFTLRAGKDERAWRMGVVECKNHGMFVEYPVLYEKPDEVVAQYKFTALLLPSGNVVRTTGGPPPIATSEHTIEDPALVELLAQTTDKKKKKKQNKKKAGGDGAKAEE
jgi:curved DNA binding protein